MLKFMQQITVPCSLTGPSGTMEFPLPKFCKLDAMQVALSQLFHIDAKQMELFWTDDEGDMIRIVDDSDLAEAMRVAKETNSVLDLHLKLNKEETNKEETNKEEKNKEETNKEETNKEETNKFVEVRTEVTKAKEEPKSEATSTKKAPAQKKKAPFRHFAICDICRKTIYGIRYKCTQCADYDHCESCEEKNGDGQLHNAEHVFAVIRKRIPALRRPLIETSPYKMSRVNPCIRRAVVTSTTPSPPSPPPSVGSAAVAPAPAPTAAPNVTTVTSSIPARGRIPRVHRMRCKGIQHLPRKHTEVEKVGEKNVEEGASNDLNAMLESAMKTFEGMAEEMKKQQEKFEEVGKSIQEVKEKFDAAQEEEAKKNTEVEDEDYEYAEALHTVCAMGFEKDLAKAALLVHKGDVSAAVSALLAR